MKCSYCGNERNLLCSSCYQNPICIKESQFSKQQLINTELKENLFKRYQKQIHNSLLPKFKALERKKKIQQLEKRIQMMNKKVEEEKERNQTLLQVQQLTCDLEQATQEKEKNKESDVRKLYMHDLERKSEILEREIVMIKRDKLQKLIRIMEIYKLSLNQYFVRKYLTIVKTKRMHFFQVVKDEKLILQSEPEQRVAFMQEQNMDETETEMIHLQYSPQTLKKMNKILFQNAKLVLILRELFINVKLPIPMLFCPKQNKMYIGNLTLTALQNQNQNMSEFEEIINGLQANIEYMYSVVGHEVQPLILIDKNFLSELEHKNFKLHGFTESAKLWKTNLKELTLKNIEDHEQCIHIEISQYKSSEVDDDDDHFEVLQ